MALHMLYAERMTYLSSVNPISLILLTILRWRCQASPCIEPIGAPRPLGTALEGLLFTCAALCPRGSPSCGGTGHRLAWKLFGCAFSWDKVTAFWELVT